MPGPVLAAEGIAMNRFLYASQKIKTQTSKAEQRVLSALNTGNQVKEQEVTWEVGPPVRNLGRALREGSIWIKVRLAETAEGHSRQREHHMRGP